MSGPVDEPVTGAQPTGPPSSPPARPAAGHDETEALARLERGDVDGTVEWLMDRYGDSVYAYCLRYTAQADLAEDLLQNTFLAAHRSLPTFRGGSTLRTWLLGIARHRCLDALRSRRRHDDRFEPVDEGPVATELDPRASSSETRELGDLLRYCLSRLSDQLRDLMILRFVLGLSYREIEDLGDLNAAALRARVSRSLPVLRSCLQENGGFS